MLSLVIIKLLNFSERVIKGPDKISKDMSGKYPILTKHCPLTGRQLQPCMQMGMILSAFQPKYDVIIYKENTLLN